MKKINARNKVLLVLQETANELLSDLVESLGIEIEEQDKPIKQYVVLNIYLIDFFNNSAHRYMYSLHEARHKNIVKAISHELQRYQQGYLVNRATFIHEVRRLEGVLSHPLPE